MKKKTIVSIVDSLEKINDSIIKNIDAGVQASLETLADCQDSAIAVGNEIERHYGSAGEETVHLLEAYCENLYQMSSKPEDIVSCRKLGKKIQKQLVQIRNHVKYDLPEDKKEIVFLPYKASMWDSLESVWKAADADPDCDAYVIPIPYFDKNPDGSFREEHYEGDLYPKDVPITRYDEYDLEARHPDVIFIHNPYDECNHVTSVHPYFYAKNLRKHTDQLVYISYFILGEDMYETMCVSPGTVFSDRVIAHSASAKEDYIRHLKKFYRENAGMQEDKAEKLLREKILPLGSPKIDKVINGKREDYPLPEEWERLLEGKKVVLYNTGVSGILHGNKQELKKIKDTIAFFAGRDDVALWWRPHPLSGGTMQSMRPALVEEYQKIVEEYKASGVGIYDDTAELHRALLWTDMYYGDDSSLVYLYGVQGKPVIRQNIACLMQNVADDRSIRYGISCSVNDSVYFCSWHYNGLYRLDITNGMVNPLGKIPCELPLEISLYSNIIWQDQTLWLVPSRAHALAEYHLETGQWMRYELPDRIKSSALIGDKIYMISSDYKYLWVMDLEEKKLIKEEIQYQEQEKILLSNEYYNDDLYLVGNKLYFLITHSNRLVIYDLESGRAKMRSVGREGNQYQRLLYDGSCFWFLPDSEKSNVVCWDGRTVKESSIKDYPAGFLWNCGLLHAVFREEKMLLFPYKGNMALRIDKESMEMESVLNLKEILNIDVPRIDNVQTLPDGKIVMAVSNTGADSRILILDTDDQVLRQYPCVCGDDMPIAFDRMFERLETEKYTSAYAYQTDEELVFSLSHACDALVNGELVFGEEKNYFRGLYANSDGTAGAHIWEEVRA